VNRARPGQIIGYTKRGRPIRLIGGASEPAAEDQGEGLGDLLDGDDGQGDEGDGEPQGEQAPPWWVEASTALETKLKQVTTSEIDRRINQLTKRRQPAGSQAPTGPDAGDIRDARAVARETIGDSGLRMSQEERELLAAYLPGAIRAGLERDPDPDSVGVHVAAQFAEQLRKLRTSYQGRILAQLEQRGVLDRSKLRPGPAQGNQGGQARQLASQWETGAAKAQELLARRGQLPQGTTNAASGRQ
jgi:hypothetical protein